MSIFFNADLCEIMFVFRFFSEKVRCLLHSSIHFNKILLVNLLKFSFLSSLLLVSTMVTFLASFWDGTHFLFFSSFFYIFQIHTKKTSQTTITDVCLALKVCLQRMIFSTSFCFSERILNTLHTNVVGSFAAACDDGYDNDYCWGLTPSLTFVVWLSIRLSVCSYVRPFVYLFRLSHRTYVCLLVSLLLPSFFFRVVTLWRAKELRY